MTALQPIRIRGDVVAGVGHGVGEVTIDEFSEKIKRRLGEVLAQAERGEFVAVYIAVKHRDDLPAAERPEDI